MAIAVYFSGGSMTTAEYDETVKALEDAGAGAPDGRLHHSVMVHGNNLAVYDVWESQEKFDAFGETLMPLLQKLEIDPGQPDILPVHNLIQ